jgi:hypothetical protein
MTTRLAALIARARLLVIVAEMKAAQRSRT